MVANVKHVELGWVNVFDIIHILQSYIVAEFLCISIVQFGLIAKYFTKSWKPTINGSLYP